MLVWLYKVETSKAVATQTSNTDQGVDIATLLTMGNLEYGQKVFKKCSACHSIKKGGKNKIGPALYNVLGRNIASISVTTNILVL